MESQIDAPLPGGSLSLSFDAIARTILPANEAVYTEASYRVLGVGPEGAGFDSGILETASYTKSGLIPGLWSLTVQGINSTSHTISEKTLTMTIAADETATEAVSLVRKSGSGTLELTVTWEVAGDYDAISGTITQVGGVAADVALVIAGDQKSASHTGTLAAGDYMLVLSFKRAGVELDTLFEAVRLYDSYTSAASYARATTLSFAYTAASPVFPVTFNDAALKRVRISGAAGKQVFLVKANPMATAVAGTAAGSAASAYEVLSYASERVADVPAETPAAGQIFRTEDPQVLEFNANPPPIPASPASRWLPGMEPMLNVVYGETPPFTVDTSTKTYWVQNAGKVWVQISATLRAAGPYSYIWVADANYDNASGSATDNKLTSAQAQCLQAKFDGTSGNSYSDGIFRNVTNIFGYEYGGGPGGDGGRDEDQHISILVYDIEYDYSSTQTGGTFGYFWSKDFYTEQQVSDWGWNIKTNYAELFYIDAHFTDSFQNVIVSTLAHEYQHMIHFNRKYVQNGQNSETWYNEMCSMVCEDLVLANIGLDPVIDGAQGLLLPTFMYSYAESGVKDWSNATDAAEMKSYASAFAFGAYLERNYGGADFFRNLLANASANEASVSAALASGGYADTFADAFRHYGEAMVYSDKPAGSAVKTFKQAQTTTLGDISYTAVSIDLFDPAEFRQFNQDTNSEVEIAGFRTYAPADVVALRPYGNSVHTQAGWTGIGDNFEVILTEPGNPAVSYYLMVK